MKRRPGKLARTNWGLPPAVTARAADLSERERVEAAPDENLPSASTPLQPAVGERSSQSAAALGPREAWPEGALAATHAGTWSWDVANNTATWDDCYHELYGFNPSEPRSFEAWLGRVHPRDRKRLRTEIERLLEPGGEDLWHQRFRAVLPVTGEHWMEGLGRIDRDQAGRALRFAGINLDITEYQRAQQALRKSEAKYRRLHESMRDAFASVDMTGRITESNRAFQAMLGYTGEELARLTYLDLTPQKWHAAEAGVLAGQVLRRGYSDVYEKEYRRKDGTIFPVELRTFLVPDDQGMPAAMWAIVRDITERKRAERALREARDTLETRVQKRTAELQASNTALRQSEEALRQREELNRTVLTTAMDGFFVLDFAHDARGAMIDANEAYCRMIGYRREELLQMCVADLDADETPLALAAHYKRLMTVGTDRFEARHRRKDGGLVQLDASVSRLAGSSSRTFAFVRDITQRKQAESLLQVQRDLSLRLSSTGDLETALSHLLEVVVRMDGVDCGGVYLFNGGTGTLDLTRSRGVSSSFAAAVSRFSPDSPQAGLVRRGRPRFATYGRLGIPLSEVERREGLRGWAILPLSHERRNIGALVLASHVTDEIPATSRVTIEMIAVQASGAIARIRAESERHGLERQILEISERERIRIGQEIHDGLCQELVSLAFDAVSLGKQLSRARRPEAAIASRLAWHLDQAITGSRQLARGLFRICLEAEGLVPALRELARATAERFRVRCHFVGEPSPFAKGDPVASHLYRIAQEAVNNALKHGRANAISISLRVSARQMELAVLDDGIGLASTPSRKRQGMGLRIMDYRARSIGGALRLGPGPRGGTLVSCRLPLPPTP